MNLDHDFFHVSRFSEDQKKTFTEKWRIFVSELKWRTEKRPNIIQRSDADLSQIIGGGGDADGDQSQIIGGDKSPHPPQVSAPLLGRCCTISYQTFFSV